MFPPSSIQWNHNLNSMLTCVVFVFINAIPFYQSRFVRRKTLNVSRVIINNRLIKVAMANM